MLILCVVIIYVKTYFIYHLNNDISINIITNIIELRVQISRLSTIANFLNRKCLHCPQVNLMFTLS